MIKKILFWILFLIVIVFIYIAYKTNLNFNNNPSNKVVTWLIIFWNLITGEFYSWWSFDNIYSGITYTWFVDIWVAGTWISKESKQTMLEFLSKTKFKDKLKEITDFKSRIKSDPIRATDVGCDTLDPTKDFTPRQLQIMKDAESSYNSDGSINYINYPKNRSHYDPYDQSVDIAFNALGIIITQKQIAQYMNNNRYYVVKKLHADHTYTIYVYDFAVDFPTSIWTTIKELAAITYFKKGITPDYYFDWYSTSISTNSYDMQSDEFWYSRDLEQNLRFIISYPSKCVGLEPMWDWASLSRYELYADPDENKLLDVLKYVSITSGANIYDKLWTLFWADFIYWWKYQHGILWITFPSITDFGWVFLLFYYTLDGDKLYFFHKDVFWLREWDSENTWQQDDYYKWRILGTVKKPDWNLPRIKKVGECLVHIGMLWYDCSDVTIKSMKGYFHGLFDGTEKSAYFTKTLAEFKSQIDTLYK